MIMDSLAGRRVKMSLKFAKNCLKFDNLKQLFPRYVIKYPMLTRNKCKYVVNRVLTEISNSWHAKKVEPKFNGTEKTVNNVVTSEL